MNEGPLRQLGFSDKEIKVYALIVKHKKIAPAALARISRINRTTVYAIAKSLIAKGLVVEDVTGKSISLMPVPPGELKKLVRKEEREFRAREKAVGQLAGELALAGVGLEYVVPKIRFVEDADVEDYLYDNLKKWMGSMAEKDGTWWGFQDDSFVEQYKKWVDWSWKNSPKTIELKLLSSKSKTEDRLRGKYARRQIKFWENSGAFTGTIWIAGDYIIMVVTQEKPYYLVEIHDAVMAHNLREMFRNLWPMVK